MSSDTAVTAAELVRRGLPLHQDTAENQSRLVKAEARERQERNQHRRGTQLDAPPNEPDTSMRAQMIANAAAAAASQVLGRDALGRLLERRHPSWLREAAEHPVAPGVPAISPSACAALGRTPAKPRQVNSPRPSEWINPRISNNAPRQNEYSDAQLLDQVSKHGLRWLEKNNHQSRNGSYPGSMTEEDELIELYSTPVMHPDGSSPSPSKARKKVPASALSRFAKSEFPQIWRAHGPSNVRRLALMAER